MTEETLLEKTGYRRKIVKAVKNNPSHPIHHNIEMQAHRLISSKGVQMAGMGRQLAGLGYDINVLENLVLLPSSLQGACHLKVQLHRGDHKYTDDDHPFSYHEVVMIEVRGHRKMLASCKGCDDPNETQRRVQKEVNKS